MSEIQIINNTTLVHPQISTFLSYRYADVITFSSKHSECVTLIYVCCVIDLLVDLNKPVTELHIETKDMKFSAVVDCTKEANTALNFETDKVKKVTGLFDVLVEITKYLDNIYTVKRNTNA